ncbi:MAG: BatD family protein, partial [Flavobacteriales bacterium]
YNTNGTKTFEYILIARQVGNFEIDEINFTYLNPKTGKYQNIKSEKYSFKIEKGKQYFPIDSTQINQQKIELLEFNGGSKISNRILIYHWFTKLFWGGILIILIIYLTSFIQNKRNSNPEHTKRRKSTKIAIKRLKNAQLCLNNNDFDVFFEEIEKSLWGYLTDKFGVKSAELSKENIDIHFNNNNIDNDFKNKFIEVLNVCELARYSPTQDQNKKMQETLNNAKEIIIKIESNLSKK